MGGTGVYAAYCGGFGGDWWPMVGMATIGRGRPVGRAGTLNRPQSGQERRYCPP